MNAELRELLKRAGMPDAANDRFWTRAVMTHVVGLLPVADDPARVSPESGFHLLMFDEGENVVRRAKCRAAEDAGFRRECDTLVALGEDPALTGMIPAVSTAASEHLRLHVSRQLSGPSYDTVLPDQSVAAWQRTAEEILGTVHSVCDRAKRNLSWLRSESPELPLGEALKSRFRMLEDQGLDADMVHGIRQILNDVSVGRQPQHGDVWPGNIIQGEGGRWCVIDYERFAEVQFPLYDALHLIWSSSQATGRTGIGRWDPRRPERKDGGWHRASQAVLSREARRHRLSDLEVGALILAFIIEITAHRMRPGAPPRYSRGLRAWLGDCGRRLESGLDLEGLAREWLP